MKQLCPACQEPPQYDTRIDAYFCEKCDIWTETICGDPDCHFCENRPKKPSLRNEKIER